AICRSQQDGDINNGKSTQELKAWVDQYKATFDIAAFRRDTSYLTMLSLLPRVIGTMDIALPVILFSSSSQRQISEEVKDYQNIITHFEKPRFVGYQLDNLLLETRYRWRLAIQEAVNILRGRTT